MPNIAMTYGSFSFADTGPIPLMSIDRSFHNTPDGTKLGEDYSVTLRNVATPISSGDLGLKQTDELADSIRDAFDTAGQQFIVTCDGATIFEGYPINIDLSFSESSNQWVQDIPYTITLTFPEGHPGLGDSFVADASEEWNIELATENKQFSWSLAGGEDANSPQMRVTHTVNATGKKRFLGSGLEKPAWQQARDYVTPLLGFNSERATAIEALNFNPDEVREYDHVRVNAVNELAGTYSVTESWLVINPSGVGVHGKAVEDFTVNVVDAVQNPFLQVNVEGSIRGLELVDFGTTTGDYAVTEYAYDNASGYYSTVHPRIYDRANLLALQNGGTSLNTLPVNSTVGHSPTKGTITYAFGYDTRPSNCFPNVRSETISINDNHPADKIALLTVLGKTSGPVMQLLNTKTEFQRELSIELLMEDPVTGCAVSGNAAAYLAQSPKSSTDEFVDAIEDNLEGTYASVARVLDSDNWQITNNTYSRTVSWTAVSC